MRLSKKDLRALAREARKLAYQCVAGTAPRLGTTRLHEPNHPEIPVCALGHVYFRALGSAVAPSVAYGERFWQARDVLLPVMEALVEANNDSFDHERHEWVVFPLLAYADAIDSVAFLAAQPPSKDSAVLEEL